VRRYFRIGKVKESWVEGERGGKNERVTKAGRRGNKNLPAPAVVNDLGGEKNSWKTEGEEGKKKGERR